MKGHNKVTWWIFMCWTSVPLLASGRLAGEGWTVRKKHACTSGTLVHAHQQLHPHGDAGVPAQRQQADVAGYDGWAQQVLYHGGAVRVPIEDLESRKRNCMWRCTRCTLYHVPSLSFSMGIHFLGETGLCSWIVQKGVPYLVHTCIFKENTMSDIWCSD